MLNYSCTGDGKDLLFIHGWASSLHMWDRLVDGLAAHHRCWAVDLPGSGDSPLPESDFITIDYYRDRLLDFCDEHALNPYAIVAHSMGGMITLKMLLHRPALAERLVLVCPAITGRVSAAGSLARGLIQSSVGRYVLKNSQRISQFLQHPRVVPLASNPAYAGQVVVKQAREDFQRTHWQGISYVLLSLAAEDLQPHLHRIKHPALVVVGEKDFTLPPSESMIAADILPQAQLITFESAHHHPHDEDFERFRAVCSQFLTSSTG